MVDTSSHAQLGHFLLTRRQRVRPADVGMLAGPRRRAVGLRREEVAVLANVSPAWYAYLEQGRKIRPSAEVLDSIADALLLDMTERRYVHALGAGPAQSVLPETDSNPDAISLVRRLVGLGDVLPYPVYASDAFGALLAWNAAMGEWYDNFSEFDHRDQNIIRWLFTSSRARERIVEWESDAREIVGRIRFFVGTNRPSPEAESLLEDLVAECPEFQQWWDEHDVNEQDVWNRTFRHPKRGACTLQLVVLRPSVHPAVSVVFHVPQGEAAPQLDDALFEMT